MYIARPSPSTTSARRPRAGCTARCRERAAVCPRPPPPRARRAARCRHCAVYARRLYRISWRRRLAYMYACTYACVSYSAVYNNMYVYIYITCRRSPFKQAARGATPPGAPCGRVHPARRSCVDRGPGLRAGSIRVARAAGLCADRLSARGAVAVRAAPRMHAIAAPPRGGTAARAPLACVEYTCLVRRAPRAGAAGGQRQASVPAGSARRRRQASRLPPACSAARIHAKRRRASREASSARERREARSEKRVAAPCTRVCGGAPIWWTDQRAARRAR